MLASYLTEGRKFAGWEINPERLCHQGCPDSWWQGNRVRLSSLVVQDVDSAYLSKVDLQSKADTLLEEVDFLKYLFQSVSQYLKYFYEMMNSVLIRNPSLLYICQGVWAVRGGGLTPNITPWGCLSPVTSSLRAWNQNRFNPQSSGFHVWGLGDGRWEMVKQSLLSGNEG